MRTQVRQLRDGWFGFTHEPEVQYTLSLRCDVTCTLEQQIAITARGQHIECASLLAIAFKQR